MITVFVKPVNYNRLKSGTHSIQKILSAEGISIIDNHAYIDSVPINLDNIKILPALKKKGLKTAPKKD